MAIAPATQGEVFPTFLRVTRVIHLSTVDWKKLRLILLIFSVLEARAFKLFKAGNPVDTKF